MTAEAINETELTKELSLLPATDIEILERRLSWLNKAKYHQLPPTDVDWWDIYLLLAGRGAGKTRSAAEWLWWQAWTQPGTRWLVGAPTASDLRDVCFAGDSGLLTVIPKSCVQTYLVSTCEIKLTNGSIIKGIPASEPERFRGPQFHGGWCVSPDTIIKTPSGGKKVQDVQFGDVVSTRHGPRKVLAAGVSGNTNDIVRIVSGETSLTLTVDHPILVGDQWIPAGEIKTGDLLWTESFTTALLGTSDRAGIIKTNGADTCTDTFGAKQTAQFRLSSWFITKTTTLKTMTLRIWFSCQSQITSAITASVPSTLKTKKKLPSGRWLNFARQSLQSAFNVALTLFPIPLARSASFAQLNAPKFGVGTSLFQSQETALFAKKSTQQSSDSRNTAANNATQSQLSEHIELKQTAVQSVERLPNSTTYNLTVEGEHEFIANGIVVHNCDELAAWTSLDEAWNMMMFGMRLGDHPRIVCTTTPKPKPLIIDLIERDGKDVMLVTASTYDNIDNLAPSFQKQILQYEGTSLGRQEIHAEIIDPEEAGIIKRTMLRLWDAEKAFPKFLYVVQSYDCATSEKTINDPTACVVLGVFRPSDDKPLCAMVIDCWSEHMQYPDLRPKVISEYEESVYGDPDEFGNGKKTDTVLIEDKSAGISLIQDLQRGGLPARPYNPGKADKVQRLNIVAPVIAAGRLYLPESPNSPGRERTWAAAFVNQLCAFPEVRHDDYVDALTQGLRFLRDSGFLDIDPTAGDDDYYDDTPKKLTNPYAT